MIYDGWPNKPLAPSECLERRLQYETQEAAALAFLLYMIRNKRKRNSAVGREIMTHREKLADCEGCSRDTMMNELKTYRESLYNRVIHSIQKQSSKKYVDGGTLIII